MMMKRSLWLGLIFMVLMLSTARPADASMTTEVVPPELTRWQSWVLYGHESELCPGPYNGGGVTRCHWPSRLELDLSDAGGTFEQRWSVFAEGWAALPGGPGAWPESVVVNGRPVPVISRNETPVVRLTPGEHRIMGRFFWSRMPEALSVPPSLGLVFLSIHNRPVPKPHIDDHDRLWLEQTRTPDAPVLPGAVQVRVFRLIDDTIPMQITTLFRLDVSGPGRDIEVDGALVPGSIAMSLESALPVRIDDGGRLAIQARAGQWEVRVHARMPGPQHIIPAGECPYGDEIWSFRARNDLRMVEIHGLPRMEPARTEMPHDWHRFPAFLVPARGTMTLKEIHRGDSDPGPNRLSLHRTWWLDFDGAGFTTHDAVIGAVRRQWYIAMSPPLVLGRVSLGGRDQVITEQGAEKDQGVQLRQGRLDLAADARLPRRTGVLPVAGWDHGFESAAAIVNLPPGWRLVAATGVDRVSEAWLERWSLLDLFLVLIIALGVFKLRGRWWGAVTLVVMILIYHEPGAPRLVWLHLLAALSVRQLLPTGGFKRLAALWGIGATLFLLVTAVPFMVQQVRCGVYPQLATVDMTPPTKSIGLRPPDERLAVTQPIRTRAAMPYAAEDTLRGETAPSARSDERPPPSAYDPDALIPTGPGLPDWRWRSVELGWTGPVSPTQTMRLYLLGPRAHLMLALLQVALLAALIWALIDWRSGWQRLRQRLDIGVTGVLAFLLLAGGGPGSAQADPYGYPPPALLEELRQRLLAPPDCLPQCADISFMEVTAVGDTLQLMFKVNSAAQVALPLPAGRMTWSPDQVFLNNAPIGGLAREADGQVWALVPAGLHTLVLVGDVSHETVIQLPLPLQPRKAAYTAQGWRLEGIHADGRVEATVQLSRLATEPGPAPETPATTLPPFLRVERFLNLGLSWQVTTTVTRLTPTGTPVVIRIPLLTGEAVTTETISSEDGHALVHLKSEQRVQSYTSNLEVMPSVRLSAPRAVPWTETWMLNVDPLWHCTLDGIPVVRHQDGAGNWQPRWQPWPGEQVTLNVYRPGSLAGQLKTIDSVALVLHPGRRTTQAFLRMTVRTHRAISHTLELPPRANLQQVMVNGQPLPARQDGVFVTVPLAPGVQRVEVHWHQSMPFSSLFRAPAVNVGHPAVNARITVNAPDNRWILFTGGPRWGPAVLFWSYLAVVVLVAAGLGRLALTPLKTWHWMLLGFGLTQIPPVLALVIVGWLLVLGLRSRHAMPHHWLPFNGIQLAIGCWTVLAIGVLFTAVKTGLLGLPDMQIAGSQTWPMAPEAPSLPLEWRQDRIGAALPQPWVVSLPMWVFRVLMLAWSFWLALSLISWLKWGWHCVGAGGMWRQVVLRRTRKASPSQGESGSKG